LRDGTEDRIFLTFDDGPDPIWTPRILEALHRSHARATFFVISPLALRFSHLVRHMIRAGHGVELHCTEHIRHTELTHAEVEADARGGLEDLYGFGVRSRLWRPPWGVITPQTQAVARDLRLELVSWNLDTHDWRGDSASEMFTRTSVDLRPGAVILMHDGLGPGARRSGCEETVALIEQIVKRARSLGCEPCPVDDPYAALGSA
jgi:peptidoglycan-N-acetylglucosamine deacetylase